MDIFYIFLYIFILSIFAFVWYIIWFYNQEKRYQTKIHYEALKIFQTWKNEIGGVSLKWVWQHYEKWILKKIDEINSNASYKTNNELRKDRE
jgi:predicted Holliday junction resolvase-like endonuclease